MSEKLCTLRTKGGGGGGNRPLLEETVLWTNPNPDTTYARNNSVPLSDSYTNYDYIKLTIKHLSTDENVILHSMLVPVSTIATAKGQTTSVAFSFNVNNITYVRRFNMVDDTTWQIYYSDRLAASGTTNEGGIPLQIIGVKKLGGWINNKTVSGTVSVTAGGLSSTVDVGFRPKKLYVYANISSTGKVSCSYDYSLSSTGYVRSVLYGSNKIIDFPSFGNSNGIASIEDNGFKIYCNQSSLVGTWYYTAIKE